MTGEAGALVASHSFLVRPYVGVEALQRSFDLAELVIGENRYPAGSILLPADQLPIRNATIEAYLDLENIRDALGEAGIPGESVRLACVIYGSVIAESRIVADVNLMEAATPFVVGLEESPLILQSPNGFDVRLFLYLAERNTPHPWRPSVPGTWLAFKEYRVSPQVALSRFSPTPLDDGIRQHYGLSPESLTYVRVGDGILDVESLDEDLDVFVDVTILRLLQENPNSALSKYIQLELAVATLWALITKIASLTSAQELGSAVVRTLSEETAAWVVCRDLATVGGLSIDQLLMAARDEPGLLRSVIEVFVSSLKTTSMALREVS